MEKKIVVAKNKLKNARQLVGFLLFMLSKVQSVAVVGLGGALVEVEVDLSSGFPGFNIVGLPDASVQEAKERVRAAIKNSGMDFPSTRRITVNLAPADLPKEGPAYDLPIAIGILANELNWQLNTLSGLFLGELALDGSLRRVNGILPVAIFAREHGLEKMFIPEDNATEACMIEGLKIFPVRNLSQLAAHLSGQTLITPIAGRPFADFLLAENLLESELDMRHIRGQEFAKRALEIAASGGHNLLMSGPPGSGKTLLARTLATILPTLNAEESMETTKIYSVAGLLSPEHPLMTKRPFRSPHHTASGVALVGGGKNPRPGEISLAHRGVLFLDELPEFPRHVLENLRQPLEDGVITISRAQGSLTFPARFMLVSSQNPCPCGFYSDGEKPCVCTPLQIDKYQKKISGPLLDRLDLFVEVPRLKFAKLAEENPEQTENSATIRARVQSAKEIQNQRFQNTAWQTNAEMGPKEIQKYCSLDTASTDLLRAAVTQMRLSARAYHRLLKVSRTIADLSGAEKIQVNHLAEALQYRAKQE